MKKLILLLFISNIGYAILFQRRRFLRILPFPGRYNWWGFTCISEKDTLEQIDFCVQRLSFLKRFSSFQ